MSVIVKIDIANGSARRRMHIENVSPALDLDAEGRRSQDQVCAYAVLVSGGRKQLVAGFEHRYGDDVTVLIAKAGDAIREKYGHI